MEPSPNGHEGAAPRSAKSRPWKGSVSSGVPMWDSPVFAAFALVQGVAAGAMLTMIAEAMLPEAHFKRGSIVGLSILLGFLAAIFFRALE